MACIGKNKWHQFFKHFLFVVMLLQLSCGTATDKNSSQVSSTQGGSVSGDTIPITTISIDAGQTVAQYNQLVSGSNLNWVYDGDGIYDPVANEINPFVQLKIKQMGIKMLRFPGGALSEYYEWKQGVGPSSTRGFGLDYDMKPQKMSFGLDEFLRFCENMDIIPVYTIGYSNNSPESAAEIVEYCNGSISTPLGALRAQNGHPAPYGVKFWEIGNEVYIYGITAEKATTYGEKTAAMAATMKNVDPAIRIGVIGLGSNKMWDESVLAQCAQQVDYLIYHGYFPFINSENAYLTNNAVIASTETMVQEIRLLQATAARYNPNLTVAVTEYNLFFCNASGEFISKQSDMQQALFIAESMRLFQLNKVLFATKWDLANKDWHYFSDINLNYGSAPSLAPSYYAQQLYEKAAMNSLVGTQTVSPSVTVQNFGNVGNQKDVPVVTAIAGKDASGRVLSVIVINRDPSNSFNVRMDIKNVDVIKEINVTTMKSPSSGLTESFIIENTTLAPDALSGLLIPAGSISLLQIPI